MKRGAGSAKGAEFERCIAKELSLWASHGAHKHIFWRTAGSGSRATVGQVEPATGDIGAIHEIGRALTSQVLLECKFYRKLDWLRFFVQGEGELDDFWRIVSTLARQWNKWPFLIVKENRRTPILIVDVHTPFYFNPPNCTIRSIHRPAAVYLWSDLLAQDYVHFTKTLRMTHLCACFSPPISTSPPVPNTPTASNTSVGSRSSQKNSA